MFSLTHTRFLDDDDTDEIVENWLRQKRLLDKEVSIHDTLDYFVDEVDDGIEILSDEESVPDLIHFDTATDDEESIPIAGTSLVSEGSIPSGNNPLSSHQYTFSRVPYGLISPSMSDDVATAWVSEINALSTAVLSTSGDDDSTNDHDSIPDLVPYISDSDSDDEEGDILWTGFGGDNILPTDDSDDDEDGIGILVTDVDEVGHAFSSRAVVDLSNDSDTESDVSAEEEFDQEVIEQPQQDIEFNLAFHPHDIVDRDGLETTMVSTNIFRAFNRSGIFAREFILYIRLNVELCREMERQGIEARVPTGNPPLNDTITQALRQVGGMIAMAMETPEEAAMHSDSDTLTAGAEESSSDGSTPSVEAPEPSSPDIVSVVESSEVSE